ncbi:MULTISPECIES: response regulator transcription factor [unclassified Leucobacter]|uniref:response regulator transcription factor n=1 Tax=unclassified Leucobacter TaxID=2621730 RepID=UPI001F5390C5|nr:MULTISPECIES: response regulator transcription factor [unclassified Leucobacter]
MTDSHQTEVLVPALRIALAEDSGLLREGLIRLFDEAGYETVVAVGDADQLLAELEQHPVDLVVLDVRMPPGFRDEGVRAALAIRERWPDRSVLLLSQHVELVYAGELLAGDPSGVGYLLKDRVASLDEFRDAVARLRTGGTVLDPEVVRGLMQRHRDPVERLTSRESEVLGLMAEGKSNPEIGEALVVGAGAVEKHISSIFQKLELTDASAGSRRVLAVLTWLRSAGEAG